jgi:hypothetical protein
MNFDDFERPLDHDAETLALKMENFLKSKGGNLLQPIRLNREKPTYYWSFANKEFQLLHPACEMYLVPWAETEKGQYYVYSPYNFQTGNVFLVPKEEIIHIGFN